MGCSQQSERRQQFCTLLGEGKYICWLGRECVLLNVGRGCSIEERTEAKDDARCWITKLKGSYALMNAGIEDMEAWRADTMRRLTFVCRTLRRAVININIPNTGGVCYISITFSSVPLSYKSCLPLF